MSLHYHFDGPLDVSALLRGVAKDIENRSASSGCGPQDPAEGEFDVAVGALRKAAGDIEKAVYEASRSAPAHS